MKWYEKGTLPVESIRQSWLSTYRSCPRKALLNTQREGSAASYYMFAGSVFHKAFEIYINVYESDWEKFRRHSCRADFWKRVFGQVFEEHPESGYSDEIDFERFAYDLIDKNILDGLLVSDIIIFAAGMLNGAGYKIAESELRIELEKPGHIPYVGTIDLLLEKEGRYTVADTKTSGLWQRFFQGKSITKQSYTSVQVEHTLQLKHYHWMVYSHAGIHIDQYMIFTPANLTKYSKGSKAGQFRGEPFHFGRANISQMRRYVEDMTAWLDMVEAGLFPRTYPSMFGKPLCPTCPYSDTCLNDTSSEFVPEYLK